jgi:hypothetical protein
MRATSTGDRRRLQASGPRAPKQANQSVAVSCVGRRLVLGEQPKEVEAAQEGLPPDGKMVGFYSYGEISPFAPGECGVLHNQTMTLTRFWEH